MIEYFQNQFVYLILDCISLSMIFVNLFTFAVTIIFLMFISDQAYSLLVLLFLLISIFYIARMVKND